MSFFFTHVIVIFLAAVVLTVATGEGFTTSGAFAVADGDGVGVAFTKLKPKSGELAQIDVEIAKLSSVEEFRVAIATAIGAVEDEENGTLTSLGLARKALDSVRAKDPEIESVFSNLSDAFFLLGDANSTLNSYLASLEADPDRLSALQERKAALNSWLKKYVTAGDD
jgi:DNA repair protein RecN (Recombination protein N)